MKQSPIARIVLTLSAILFSLPANPTAGQTISADTLPKDCYLFCSFRGNGDGLHLAYSTDGLKWTAVGDDHNFLVPEIGGKLMRDPCIIQNPDGVFRMVWTSGWYERMIGYASSKDLIHWSEQKAIPVMDKEPTARNSWAPELFYDVASAQYIIYWSTTIPGRFTAGEDVGDNGLNHRIYCTTTKDFETFTPTKLFYDPGFSVIDATLFKIGDDYHMVVKDETRTPPKKYLRVATGKSAFGPWTDLAETFTPPGAWVEGPSVIKIGDYYHCYFDMYLDHKYGVMRSKDLKTWEDLTPQLSFSVRDIRHGTAFKVDRSILVNLLSSTQSTTQPVH